MISKEKNGSNKRENKVCFRSLLNGYLVLVCVCLYTIVYLVYMCFFFTKLSSLDSRVSAPGLWRDPIFLSCPFQLFIEPCDSKSVSICREYAAYLVGIFFYSMHFSRLFNIISHHVRHSEKDNAVEIQVLNSLKKNCC